MKRNLKAKDYLKSKKDKYSKIFLDKALEVHGDKYDYSKFIYSKSNENVEIICKKHGVFLQTPNDHKRGRSCPKCSTNAKINLKDFLKRAYKKHGDLYDYSKTICSGSREKVEIVCKKHGSFWQRPDSHYLSSGCPKCGKEGQVLTNKEFLKKCKATHGNRYDYSDVDYKSTHFKIKIKCKKHGIFEQAPKCHLQGRGCPECSLETTTRDFKEKNGLTKSPGFKRDRVNKREGRVKPKKEKPAYSFSKKSKTELFIEKAKRKHENRYDYSSVIYVKNNEKVIIKCELHGDFLQTPQNHLQGDSGSGCNSCAKKNRSLSQLASLASFLEKCKKQHGDYYDYSLVDYEGSRKDVKVVCPKHGIFIQWAASHSKGHGCRKCNNRESSQEELIKSYLKENNIIFEENTRRRLNGKELDFFIILKNQKLAIECNGLYWHSEEKVGKKYHLEKTKECEKRGIQLIHIFENEILEKPKIVKNRLKNILKLNKYKIFARKCKIREIPPNVKGKFLNKYHLQGNDKSLIKLGLFYKERLVSVMTFCKNRKALGKTPVDGEWELSRFCSIGNFSIIGGASKLLKHFERVLKPDVLTSYANKRWSFKGGLYEILGFKLLRESPPSYWYFKSLKIFHRFGFRKNVLKNKLDDFDENMTEWENMKANGWNRIWDCGNFVFEKRYGKRFIKI